MRILIADDHDIVRRGVHALLASESSLQICGEAVDGRDAIQKTCELNPDAVVMDVSMPHLNGLEASREIRRLRPATKIVILSQYDIPEMMRLAFAVGASGYVVKSAVSTQLLSALHQIRLGESFFTGLPNSAKPNLDVREILQRSSLFEEALHETAERLHLAQQVARIGTFEFNVKTGVNRWTPELEALYGLRPGTFGGTCSAWEQLVHPDDRSATVAAFQQATDVGAFEGEWRVLLPDGSIRWLLGRTWLFRDEFGRPEKWIGVNIDITERKRSEERVEKLSRLLDLSFDAIVVRDSEDRVRYWNRGAQDMYGWTSEEASGRITHSLLKTTFPEPLDHILATLRTQGRWEGELKHCCKDGERVAVLSRWGLLRDWESGKQWVLETNTELQRWKPAEEHPQKSASPIDKSVRLPEPASTALTRSARAKSLPVVG